MNTLKFPIKQTTGLDRLTAREVAILRLLAEGSQYKGIAEKLNISIDTVRTYISRIYHKLQVHSGTQAVVKFLDLES